MLQHVGDVAGAQKVPTGLAEGVHSSEELKSEESCSGKEGACGEGAVTSICPVCSKKDLCSFRQRGP